MNQSFTQRAQLRDHVLRSARQFFEDAGFLEVDTPVTITAPAPELHVEAPEVMLETGGVPQRRFLQTSPELPMKRLLARGLSKIYQLAPVFRDGETSPQHRPEFRMLEWYRRGETWQALMTDCEGLLRGCCNALHGSSTLAFGSHTIDLGAAFRRVSVDEAFVKHAGFSILERLEPESLRRELDKLGITHSVGDSWNDLFHRVFLTRVEPALLEDPSPCFLTHYPAPLASLAQLAPHDPRVAERFELYVGGLELANGFGELCNAAQQRTRFEEESAERAKAGRRNYPMPETFLAELPNMGSAAGIALGWERLLMLLSDAHEIDEVALIAWRDA